MSFNRRLVNSYREEDLKSLLANPSRYRRIILDKFSRKDKECTLVDLSMIDALDNYIIKMLNTTPWLLNKQDLINYRDFLYSIHNTNRSIVFDSILFKKANIDKVFSSEQNASIMQTKRHATINANNELKKLLSAPGQTASDMLLRFAEVQLDIESPTVKNFVDNLFSYILNNPDTNKGFYAREFMIKYAAMAATKDLKIPPVEIYLTNYNLSGNKINSTNLGGNYTNTSIININRDYALDKVISEDKGLPNYLSIIHTVSHEVKHSSQAYNLSNGEFTLESFNYMRRRIFADYLSDAQFDEYNANYIHNEIESDSNYYGWKQTERIVKKFRPDMVGELSKIVSNSIVTSFQEETATKISNVRKKRMAKEKFNVESLDEIIKNHPELLNTYPQLRQIYSPNGKRFSFIERLRLKKQSSIRNIDAIYKEFDIYDFHSGEIGNVDVNALKQDEQFLYFNTIFNMTIDEIKSFKNSVKVFNLYPNNSDFRAKEFQVIGVLRIKRIIDLVGLINANQSKIERLDAINKRNGSPQVFMINLNYVRTFLKSCKKYADEFKGKYGNDAEKAAMIAELSSLEQVEVFENGSRK